MKTEELRKLLEEDKLLIGANETMRAMKMGKVKRLILARNVSESVKYDLMRLAEIGSVPVVELSQSNHELGTLCRKKHAISVIGERA